MAAIKFIKRTVSLDGGSVSDPSPNAFFDGEQGAHTFIIAAMRGGEPLMLSGAVSGVFLNPNDAAIPLYGSILDGAAVLTLSDDCYALTGRFTLTIDVNGATIYECNSRVKRRSSGTAYDPNDELTVAALSAEIAEMRTASAQATVAATTANQAATNALAQAQAATNTANQASSNAQQAISNLNSTANNLQNKIDQVDADMDTMQDEIDALNDGGLVLKDDVIAQNVQDWLDDHPEATTTVQDHSITLQKIAVGAIGYVMPESYGAVGDGVTDDTTAMQAAMNSGKIVLLDNKTYLVSATLAVPNNLCMVGHANSRLLWVKKDAAYQKFFGDGVNNIHLENIVFDSNTQDYSASDFTLTNGQNIEIINCSFVNVFGTALRIHGTQYFEIAGCTFENITGENGNPGECIYGVDFHDGHITNCICNHVGDHFLYADGKQGIYNITISGCIMNDTGNNGLTNGGAICLYGNVYDTAIANCTFTPTGAGIFFGGQTYSTTGVHNSTVSNCTFDGGTFGIMLYGKDTYAMAYNITVSGCTLRNISNDAIRLLYAKYITLSDIIIENAATYGIAVDTAYDSTISNITVIGVSGSGTGVIFGTGLALGVVTNFIVSNIMLYGNPLNPGQYPIYFRRGSGYIIGKIYNDANFQYASRFPSDYISDERYTTAWTPVKSSGSYAGDITSVTDAQYCVNGANVYIYATFEVDAAGTGYMLLEGLPSDLLAGPAFGNTIISNSGKIGLARTTTGGGNLYLAVYFGDDNPVLAAGNTINVWATGIKKQGQ